MFTGRHPNPCRIFVLDHNPISSGINPTGVRVPHYYNVIGTNIAATIKLMYEWYGEFIEINIIITIYIFQYGAFFHFLRWNKFELPFHSVTV